MNQTVNWDNATQNSTSAGPDTVTNVSSGGGEPRSEGVNAAVSSLVVFIIVVAVVGNVMVILAVNLYHRLKEEVANLFIVNLCTTDLSNATIVMLTSAVAVGVDRWPFGRVLCHAVCGANYCFIIVSMLTLCFISLDRYVAINHSLRYHAFVTRGRVLALLGYAWLQGLAFGLAPIACGWVEYDYWEATCAIQWHRYGTPVLLYVIVAFVVCFFLPGVVLIVAYCKIFRTVKKIQPRPAPIALPQLHSSNVPSQPAQSQENPSVFLAAPPGAPNEAAPTTRRLPLPSPSPKPSKVNYSESSKAVRSLLIVVLAYFICMTPFSVTKLYKVCVPVPDALPGYANMIATFFQYISSAVNPLIYGLFRRDFQKAFLYLLWRAFRRQNIDGSRIYNSSSLTKPF